LVCDSVTDLVGADMIEHLDHLVLTVSDVEVTCAFYADVLGMRPVTFGNGRRALEFGRQKINLHPVQTPIAPHARQPMPGSADLCFVATKPLDEVLAHLREKEVPVLEGPVPRTGAQGPITSVYFRDPDGNLIEVSRYE
jgi:catechol 2,3-dioxygenase-like lactoylglutathione lyase family enzyme